MDDKRLLGFKKEPSGAFFETKSDPSRFTTFSFSIMTFHGTTPDTLVRVRLREELIGIFAGLMR